MRAPHRLIRHLTIFLLASAPLVASASEDGVRDDVRRDSNDAKRSVKKAGHRVEEAGCMGTRSECARRKAKHRVQEATDHAKDKVAEVNDQLQEDVK
jgi:hypothetical protein